MADYSHILFNKTPDQLRLLGARGGKAYGRNQRARRALAPLQPELIARPAVPQETTPAAIAILDAQFPWLRGVENRVALLGGCRDNTDHRTGAAENRARAEMGPPARRFPIPAPAEVTSWPQVSCSSALSCTFR